MADWELELAVPPPDLTAYVGLFYRIVVDDPRFEEVERADCAQLRFRLSPGRSDYALAGGDVQPASPRHVIGATCGAMRSRAEGPLRLFGLSFTAAGWAAIVGLDASAARGRVLDADALFGEAVIGVWDRLRRTDTVGAMVAAVVPFLAGLIREGRHASLRFAGAVDGWLATEPMPGLDVLLAATGLSRRQVERLCNQLYGAPPKLLARKYRALRAASALAGGAAGDSVVLDGFYDQSHMIREVKQFTGLTPRTLRVNAGTLARMTIRQRRALAGQVSPIISHS